MGLLQKMVSEQTVKVLGEGQRGLGAAFSQLRLQEVSIGALRTVKFTRSMSVRGKQRVCSQRKLKVQTNVARRRRTHRMKGSAALFGS